MGEVDLWDIPRALIAIWDLFVNLLTEFIWYPVKIFEYLVSFAHWFMIFLEILFNVISYCVNHIWFLAIIYIGVICVQTYFQHKNSPHERLIAFFHNLFKTSIYIIKHMFYIFKMLYELSIKIIMKVIEMIPVVQ